MLPWCDSSSSRACTSLRGRWTLYAVERADGAGARLQDAILWMAIAANLNMSFGGLISTKICNQSHGTDVFVAAAGVLGISVPGDLFVEDPPPFDLDYRGLKDFRNALVRDRAVPDGAHVVVRDRSVVASLPAAGFRMSDLLTPRFLQSLRDSTALFDDWMLPAWMPDQKLPLVAVHLRRGDVVAANDSYGEGHRMTPDAWYYEVVRRIRTVLPDADVHVFSSTEGNYASQDFDGYRLRHMTVHLDGNILDSWVAMARARVLVMAKSSFSQVPAFLNPHCVIYQPYWNMPLEGWIVAAREGGENAAGPAPFETDELKDCLDRDRTPQARV
ncbi:unnamed protein product [Prorocentrum cordatum]|uniref:Peptide-O-fucosyltransferase 1 n=1 Tax=Prorocentrum cordatum TaxID=2364126 RepID=A0ABN9VYA1_9DINO|nr:unnamed protein product [Polarella glacialis]